jgi:hypothetical protein
MLLPDLRAISSRRATGPMRETLSAVLRRAHRDVEIGTDDTSP